MKAYNGLISKIQSGQISKLSKTLEVYNGLLGLTLNEIAAWQGKGNALYSLKCHEDALEAYEQFLKLTHRTPCPWEWNYDEKTYRFERKINMGQTILRQGAAKVILFMPFNGMRSCLRHGMRYGRRKVFICG
ncbi:MAG: tetratricopeptide repeat protein [Deltaproteobacteria bacterium]|nr:tetratricopeptide repeat protein [Deltaproteobacteria bacterium]